MTYFDYLFTILIIGFGIFLLVGFTFHFAYRLGEATGSTVERLRWYQAQVHSEFVGLVEEPQELVEWPKELNCE